MSKTQFRACPRYFDGENCNDRTTCQYMHCDFLNVCHKWFQGICRYPRSCWNQHGNSFDTATRSAVRLQEQLRGNRPSRLQCRRKGYSPPGLPRCAEASQYILEAMAISVGEKFANRGLEPTTPSTMTTRHGMSPVTTFVYVHQRKIRTTAQRSRACTRAISEKVYFPRLSTSRPPEQSFGWIPGRRVEHPATEFLPPGEADSYREKLRTRDAPRFGVARSSFCSGDVEDGAT